MKRYVAAAALALAVASAAGCKTGADGGGDGSGIKEAPVGDNQLHWWGLAAIRYDDMPAAATLSRVPWPGDYWATYRGGIAHRWQTSTTQSESYKQYLYAIPTAQQLAGMNEAKIAKLSPAEKYDLWLGRTDLKSPQAATGSQRAFMLNAAKINKQLTGQDAIPTWTGICNGWSVAAIREPQPMKAVKVTNAAGQVITFYPGDIKALLSQIYFDYQPYVNVARLGTMCGEATPEVANGRIVDPACRDVNPMTFHAALAGSLAKDEAFVFDVDSNDEVWNQPVYGYKVAFANKRALTPDYTHAAAGTVALVDVKAELQYMVESEPEKAGMTPAQVAQHISRQNYAYTLELNEAGVIIGGEWKPGSKIPDFMWRPDEGPSDEILAAVPGGYPLSLTKVRELAALAQP